MNFKRNVLRVLGTLLFACLAGFGTGCGGFSASKSISPATFLLPGFMLVEPPNSSPVAAVEGSEKSPEIAAYSSDLVR